MGFYRLILAFFVALSHAGVTIKGYNPGVVSVVSFFLLSGLTMNGLMQRYYASYRLIKSFYIDRIFRLSPQFLFYLFATLILVTVFKISSPYLLDITPLKVLLNVFILPLNFFMLGLDNCLLVPPAWCLGLEMSFYIVYPFILLSKNIIKCIVFSLFVFIMAYLGIINTDYFGYRLLPGVLFFFLAGSCMNNNHEYLNSNLIKRMPYIIWLVAGALFILLLISSTRYAMPYNKEVLIGAIIGIPCILILKNFSSSKLDKLAGNLSYGVFLNHFFVIWSISAIKGTFSATVKECVILLFLSMILSYITFTFIEKPLSNLRRKYRSKIN